ncbi:Diaminopimelate epimerase-like protein [Sporormia fimetaria CBS 119925]|uniref:Diaminopimelate epimerase-like protein n=1 Tax=Sporormia fimetaria CBS 119925 TaxID=1340428 RepID=A0A6A6VSG5_9PLEO|nr:Diaminopimelate epimerase-like protein [Sporormia fimetaria CBS 119925]
MQLPFTTLDVFTTTRLKGNPLAIVRVPSSLRPFLSEAQKLAITREFNLSETVFLHEPVADQDFVDYDIFTPGGRLSFAGHPTIGTALYVARNSAQYPGIKRLRTDAGFIEFEITGDEGNGKGLGKVDVKIPQDVYVHRKELEHPYPESRAEASVQWARETRLVSVVKGMTFACTQLYGKDALGKVDKGLFDPVTAFDPKKVGLDEGSGWDKGYTGSFFFVDCGVDGEDEGRRVLRTRMFDAKFEDPGTGSASCALAGWLALCEEKEKGEGPFGYHLVQGVDMGRRCDIFVSVRRSKDGERVEEIRLGGAAIKVMEGVVEVDEEA